MDFRTGVRLAEGEVEVTFVNTDVGSDGWSYGVTSRHSEEETFHAVYMAGDGPWEHFVRAGSPESEMSLGHGTLAFNSERRGGNDLKVVFDTGSGLFFANGRQVNTLDVSATAASDPGDARVMSGILGSDAFNGAV